MTQPIDVLIQTSKDGIILPQYAHKGDSGMDIRNAGESVSIPPLGRALIPTSLSVAIPEGYEIQIRPRSGLALRKGISVLNSPGTIDSNYRGEIGIILFNLSNENVVIEPHERIAQLVLNRVYAIRWKEELKLEKSNRNSGGFGSTGTE